MTVHILAGDIYYNTQIFFAKNILPSLPNDDGAWAKEYRVWLKEQGAIIVTAEFESPLKKIYRNALGVLPGHDFFEFEKDSDATIFVLRWT
jgi:hypothetical protein